MMKNKIAVIGGTGKSGAYLTRQLLQRDFPIKMLLRDPQKLTTPHPHLTIVPGNARDYAAIDAVLEGCDAVISTLGGHTPGEPSVFSVATANILRAMQVHGIKRYIVTTGLNVDTPWDKKSAGTAAGTQWMKDHYPVTTADKQIEWERLSASEAAWTLVRLPMIELTDVVREIVVSLEDCAGSRISAASLARFLVDQLHDAAYLRAAPFVADK